MTPRWEDLNARARGLSTHLLRRGGLEALVRAPDIPALALDLRHFDYPVAEGSRVSAADVELGARRAAASRFAILVRWMGPRRADALRVLVEDEERRSLRSIVRGAAQQAPPEQRLAGLLPTPALPERALRELARQSTPAAVASLLVAWRHPYGPPLLRVGTGPESDLFSCEMALNRAFAERARAAAPRGILREYVRQVIDIENAYAILLLAGEPGGPPPAAFLPGGRQIGEACFQQALATGEPARAARVVTDAFASTPLAGVFGDASIDAGGLERAVIAVQIAQLHRLSLRQPLSVAPLLEYALRLRGELLDVRWAVWGVSLGAPAALLAAGLATPP